MISTIWVVIWFQQFSPASNFATPLAQTSAGVPANNLSSSNGVKEFLVFPTDDYKNRQNEQVLQQLQRISEEHEVKMIATKGIHFGNRDRLHFWLITIDKSRYAEVTSILGVSKNGFLPSRLNANFCCDK